MTNELEKQFFQCFGIEPREFKSCDVGTFCPYPEKECGTDICPYYKTYAVDYPAISDRILLELIRIIGLITIKYTNEQCEICYGDGAISYLGKDLKEAILNFFISKVSIFKHQVRTLFEEG